MNAATPAYDALHSHAARTAALGNALGILHWDTETTMPQGAAGRRAESLATLARLHHEHLTDPQIAEWLAAAEGEDGLDEWRRANLRELRRGWLHATAVPADLVEANARAVAHSEVLWRQARADSDFAVLLPALNAVLQCQREIAEAKAAALDLAPYDALLDGYEPGLRLATITPLFQDLAGFLPEFTERVLDRQASQPPAVPPRGPFPVETQRSLALELMEAAGFDFARGRLDASAHPFCGGADDDVRLTTRYDEQDVLKSVMAVLHETGHALYEQGRPTAWMDQPVGRTRGMMVHESQSLLVEMQACRGHAFSRFLAGRLAETFAGETRAWTPANLHRLVTRVERGFIRVDADEVTYPAHIVLRTRLEQALLSGDLPLAELPAAWNSAMRELLGVTPPDDRLGCLQDIHWPSGAFGYFPTYTLGALMAAQLYAAAEEQVAELESALAEGDFSPLVAWLRANVHSKGSLLSAEEILTQATGEPLGTVAFKAHLQRRYLPEG